MKACRSKWGSISFHVSECGRSVQGMGIILAIGVLPAIFMDVIEEEEQ